MRFLLCIFIVITFFQSISFAQPYINESRNHNKFKCNLNKISITENSTFKNLQEEFTSSQSIDTDLRVYPTAFDPNSTLLLYLRSPAHTVQLSIIDMLGNTVNMPLKGELDKGFYEFSVLSNTETKGIFIARLVIDGKIYSKHIIR